jgi:hypothetical protein
MLFTAKPLLLINIATTTYLHDQYTENIVLNIANDSVVPNTISPIGSEVSG